MLDSPEHYEGTASPQIPKKKFMFKTIGESDEALAAKKAKVQFTKNGLTVFQKTRVLSMSPSRTLMSMNRENSYGQLLRGSGNLTLADGSQNGSNQNSFTSLTPNPMNFQMPPISPGPVLNATNGTEAAGEKKENQSEKTLDKLGNTYYTLYGSTSRNSGNEVPYHMHTYNMQNIYFTADGASLQPSKPPITDEERDNVGKSNLELSGSKFTIKPHRFSMVNQESFVAKIQKTVDERILKGQLSERSLKERTDMSAQLKQF